MAYYTHTHTHTNTRTCPLTHTHTHTHTDTPTHTLCSQAGRGTHQSPPPPPYIIIISDRKRPTSPGHNLGKSRLWCHSRLMGTHHRHGPAGNRDPLVVCVLCVWGGGGRRRRRRGRGLRQDMIRFSQ